MVPGKPASSCLLRALCWVALGGQPQLLCVPPVRPQRASQSGAVDGCGRGQPKPSEGPQNSLQHPPAGFGECPSIQQRTLGWEIGGSSLSGQWAWLWPEVCDLGGAFRGSWGTRPELGCPPVVLEAYPGHAFPPPCPDKHGVVWVPSPLAYSSAMLTLSHHLQRVVLSFDFPFYGHPLRQITIATGGKAVSVGLGAGLEVVARTWGTCLTGSLEAGLSRWTGEGPIFGPETPLSGGTSVSVVDYLPHMG